MANPDSGGDMKSPALDLLMMFGNAKSLNKASLSENNDQGDFAQLIQIAVNKSLNAHNSDRQFNLEMFSRQFGTGQSFLDNLKSGFITILRRIS